MHTGLMSATYMYQKDVASTSSKKRRRRRRDDDDERDEKEAAAAGAAAAGAEGKDPRERIFVNERWLLTERFIDDQ
jgi:hypothetical protein